MEGCIICFDPLQPDKKDSITLLCNHQYHSHCLFGYLYYKITKGRCSDVNQLHCPTCRQNDLVSLRNIVKTTIRTNETNLYKLKELKSTRQRQYTLMEWSFKIKALWKQPTKMKILDYIKNEDLMYEQLCETDNNIKSLQNLNEQTKTVLQFINSCVKCL